MKKLTLLFAAGTLFLALQSCKGKEKPAEATPTTTEVTAAPTEPSTPAAASEVVQSIVIPTFSNADVTKFCEEFKTLMTEYGAAKGTGDKTKELELENKFNQWGNKGASLGGKLKPEEMKSFNDFITAAAKQFEAMRTASAK